MKAFATIPANVSDPYQYLIDKGVIRSEGGEVETIKVESSKDIKGKSFFHGTFSNFDTFEQQGDRGSEAVDMGFHFGSKQAAEKSLSNRKLVEEQGRVGLTFARGIDTANPIIKEVTLDIKNPLRLEENRTGGWSPTDVMIALRDKFEAGGKIDGFSEKDIDDIFDGNMHLKGKRKTFDDFDTAKEQADFMQQYLNEKGYDGIVYDNKIEGGGDSLIAFRPEQIKELK